MPRNLLVVDDSATIRDAVRYALTGEDWVVVTAADTAEALETVRDGAIDAVLCDASLAPDDGYETCRTLRSAMGDQPVPIVVMGGKVSENLAASAGATAVLTKPFESEELLEVLRAGLEQGSFDLAAEDFAPLDEEDEEEIMADLTPAAAVAGSSVEEEVEIIDLSGDDEAEDLELLQDLQPLTAASVGAAEASAASSREWDLEGMIRPLDLEDTAEVEEPEEGLHRAGPVEFDLADLGGEEDVATPSPGALAFAEPSVGVEIRSDETEGEEAPEFDLQDLDLDLDLDLEPSKPAPLVEAARVPAPEPRKAEDLRAPAGTDDLLGDIDLEGWAEESFTSIEESAPTAAATTDLAWTEPSNLEMDLEMGHEELEPVEAAESDGLHEMEEPEEEAFEEEALAEPLLGEAAEFPEVARLASEAFGEVEMAAAPEEAASGHYGGAEELPPEPAAAEPETDATWAEPRLTRPTEGPWDQQLPQSDALTEPVARAAEQAVREALAASLSPQALTPVVEAVVERVVWEVVPQLAERLIREAIERLQQEPTGD